MNVQWSWTPWSPHDLQSNWLARMNSSVSNVFFYSAKRSTGAPHCAVREERVIGANRLFVSNASILRLWLIRFIAQFIHDRRHRAPSSPIPSPPLAANCFNYRLPTGALFTFFCHRTQAGNKMTSRHGRLPIGRLSRLRYRSRSDDIDYWRVQYSPPGSGALAQPRCNPAPVRHWNFVVTAVALAPRAWTELVLSRLSGTSCCSGWATTAALSVSIQSLSIRHRPNTPLALIFIYH